MHPGWEERLDTRPALERIAGQVATDAARMAPVDTGALRNSIRYEANGNGASARAAVGSDLEYSVYVELGTSRMSAQPYLRPAVNKRR